MHAARDRDGRDSDIVRVAGIDDQERGMPVVSVVADGEVAVAERDQVDLGCPPR